MEDEISSRTAFAHVVRGISDVHAYFPGIKSNCAIAMVTSNSIMARHQLSMADRGRALAWHQDGEIQHSVVQGLNVSLSVIGWLWQRFSVTGSLNNRPRSGRPPSATPREEGT